MKIKNTASRFLCICVFIDDKFGHKYYVVKVVWMKASGSADYFDNELYDAIYHQ